VDRTTADDASRPKANQRGNSMRLQFAILATAAIAAGFSLSARAQPEPSHERFNLMHGQNDFRNIEIKNFQDETLGRIKDLAIDLTNGRIVEVLVVCDSSLDVDSKIVAVPPLALLPDVLNEVYRLNASVDLFKSAPGIDLSKWVDAGRSDRVSAAYRLFGRVPYFLEEGAVASKMADRPKVPLGYVELSSKIQGLQVGNLQNQQFGKVFTLTMDIPKGRIRSVIVVAPGNLRTKTVIPAMALSFNAARDALLLDDTKLEYEDEPRYIFVAEAYGHGPFTKEESYEGPHTSDALEQGTSYRDIDHTVRINKLIRQAKIGGRNIQVGTINDRITLRGWVSTDDDKRRAGEIAITASRLELVDNQITVGKPVTAN
jgi:sporulation protein YlmC with PRC-barrel domain